MKNAAYNLGHLLRSFRLACSFTQERVAKHLGITRQAYSHYENNISVPDTKMLIRIADYFEIPVMLLIDSEFPLYGSIYNERNPSDKNPSVDLTEFLSFYKNPENIKKYHFLSRLEKEMLFFFQMLSENDKQDLLLFAYVKSKSESKRDSSYQYIDCI